MADSTCKHCYGSGFDINKRICVFHLEEAYKYAMEQKDVEMAAAIVWKQREMNKKKKIDVNEEHIVETGLA